MWPYSNNRPGANNSLVIFELYVLEVNFAELLNLQVDKIILQDYR